MRTPLFFLHRASMTLSSNDNSPDQAASVDFLLISVFGKLVVN